MSQAPSHPGLVCQIRRRYLTPEASAHRQAAAAKWTAVHLAAGIGLGRIGDRRLERAIVLVPHLDIRQAFGACARPGVERPPDGEDRKLRAIGQSLDAVIAALVPADVVGGQPAARIEKIELVGPEGAVMIGERRVDPKPIVDVVEGFRRTFLRSESAEILGHADIALRRRDRAGGREPCAQDAGAQGDERRSRPVTHSRNSGRMHGSRRDLGRCRAAFTCSFRLDSFRGGNSA